VLCTRISLFRSNRISSTRKNFSASMGVTPV
jgi:hypothetical protein